MKALVRCLVCSSIFLTGCGAAHDVAVTSYHVVTAPVHLVHRQIDKPSTTTTTTTTTGSSDVTTPSQPVPTTSASPRVAATGRTGGAKPKTSPSPRFRSSQPEFPTATPVPGRPGYVFSPSDQSKYVDVSGYAPGSKVKDPYSGKIFLVP